MATTDVNDLLHEVDQLLAPIAAREERAKRLRATTPSADLFVGILGASVSEPEIPILNGFAQIRPVTNPPGLVHVCIAANKKHSDYLTVARYSQGIRAELCFGNSEVKALPLETLVDLSYHTAALIRLKTRIPMLCPLASTHSWDVISACEESTVNFYALDDVPRRIIYPSLSDSDVISYQDMEWVNQHWMRALKLRNATTSRRFGLAFNLMYIWDHVTDRRLAIANLWSGLEALFGERGRGVTRRLIGRICAWLPSVSHEEVSRAYDIRCRAVHGCWLADSPEIQDGILNSARILRDALAKCIETETRTLPDWRG